MKCEVPTKSRIESLLLKQRAGAKCHPPSKVIISLGIVLTTCGVILCIFGIVSILIDSVIQYLNLEAWIGALIIICGFITVLSGSQRRTQFKVYLYVFTSIISISATGILSILTVNAVIRIRETEKTDYEQFERVLQTDKRLIIKSPQIMIYLLTLVFSSISFLVAVVNFCLGSQEACECYSTKYKEDNASNFIKYFSQDTLGRRDRIIKWIIQQSELQCDKSLWDVTAVSESGKKRLQPSISGSTSTTRLSAYEI